ncbi:MAG: WD40 repeat domain-containing protein [Bacteroidota bacterium]
MKSPFKFLDSYTREDRSVFFGRDQEITDLYRRVFESKMLLVYGISGTGKSSLVNCGLASRFDESDWLPVNVRRGNNIGDSLNDAFSKQALTPLKKNQTTSEKLQSIYLDHFKPVYLLFDQFEELFIFGSQEEKKEFISTVKELTESETQCRIIFIIREEFLAGMTEFEEKLPDIFTNRFRVEKMKRTNAINAVEGPCRVYGIEIEAGFSEELIDKLCPAGNEIELTYLQIYLDRIFRLAVSEEPATRNQQLAPSNIKFTNEHLTRAGSVSDLLGQFLDEQIRELDDPEKGMTILKSFVSIQGTRRQMTEREILDSISTFGTTITEQELTKYLTRFVDLRLLRERDETGHYELRHDALAGKIYEKFTALEKDIIEVKQFIENSFSDFQKRGKLIATDDLEYIAPYESRLYLSKDQSGLIEKSRNALSQAKRRRRNIVAASTVTLLIIFAGFTLWALGERNKARDQRNKALAEKYNFVARDLASSDPTKALYIAEYAHNLDTGNSNIWNNIEKIYYENNIYSVVVDSSYNANSVAFSPDGRRLVAGCSDRTVRIFDLDVNELKIIRQASIINTVALSPDGAKILTGSRDNIARLYDLDGSLLQVFEGHSGGINSVVFSSNGQNIIIGSNDNTARLWDINGKILRIFKGHTDIVGSAVFSPDDKIIATGSYDNTVRFWDLNGNILKVLKGPSSEIGTIKFSPDGKKLVAACDDNTALLWDLESNSLHQFRGHQCSISTIDISHDGQYVLTGSCDNTCRLWDLQGNLLQIFRGHTSYINSVAFAPDGKTIVSSSFDGTIRLWKNKGLPIFTFRGHKGDIISLALSPDGQKLLTGSTDNTARLWGINGNLNHVFTGHTSSINALAFSPDCQKILTCSDDNTARLWDTEGKTLHILEGHTGPVIACSFSPDGKTIITGGDDKTVRFWDVDGNEVRTIKLISNILAMAFSPDGQRILTGSDDNIARLWDINGRILQIFKGHTGPIYCVAFSTDGDRFLTGSEDNTACLWDNQGDILQVFREHTTWISSMAFSPDGNNIITVSEGDNTARLWNLNGNVILTFKGHTSGIGSVIFSPGGQEILTGSRDLTAKLWSAKTSYQEFSKGYNYSKLGTTDRIKYKIISFSQLLKSHDETELSEAADYYLQESAQLGITEKKDYLKNAISLYKKLLKEHSDGVRFRLNLLKSYYLLNLIEPSEMMNDKIRQLNGTTPELTETDDLLLSLTCKTDLFKLRFDPMLLDNIIEANNLLTSKTHQVDLFKIHAYYSLELINVDSTAIKLQFPESDIKVCEKLINDQSVLKSELNRISVDCSNLSWRLMIMKKFELALKAAMVALKADSTNGLTYTNLPLAYIFNNNYSEAEKIYKEFKNRILEDGGIVFSEVFLADIEDLEGRGITHPDFEKVRELLK